MKNQQLTPKRIKFNEKYNDLSDSDIQKELLFAQQLTVEKLDRIKSNTSTLIWTLIIIPILVFIAMSLIK